MFAFLGIIFSVAFLILIVMILVNFGSTQYSDNIGENTATSFLVKVLAGLLLIGITVCWLKSCH